MKDYIQVSESVFRKAEERMAEKKRRSMKVKRNTLAATGAAAVLFVVLMQNEDISNAIKSFPKFVSSMWSGDEPTTTQMTTQPTVTTTAAVTTTQAVTDTTETTTEETTTTSTTTTTTQPVTTEPPIVTTVSPIDGLPRMRSGSWSEEVVATTNDTLTFANGMTINFAYGSPDFRNQFKVGDEIIYSGSFAYDKSNKIYYYLSEGRFEKCGGLSVQSAYHEEQETEKTTEYHNDNTNDDKQYDDHEGYPDDYPEDYDDYEDYEDDDYGDYVDKPFEYVDDGTPAMDYAEIINDPDFVFQDRNFYKLKVNGIKVKSKEGAYIISEDGQKWIFSTHSLSGMTESEVYGIKEGDVLNMEGYFYYLAFDSSIYNLEMKIEKVK